MTRNRALRVLGEHREELRCRFGVKSLDLFGSIARGEGKDTSDVDLLVEFDRPVGFFHIFELEEYLGSLLGGLDVDLVLRSSILDELRNRILDEAIHVL